MVVASAFHIGHYIIGTESTLRNWCPNNTYLSWPRHDDDSIMVDDELIRRRLHTSMRKGSFNATYPNIAHFFNHIPKVSKVIGAYPLLFILNMTLLLLVYFLDRGILCMLLTEPNGWLITWNEGTTKRREISFMQLGSWPNRQSSKENTQKFRRKGWINLRHVHVGTALPTICYQLL